MTWFAFKNDGHVYELIGIAEKELVATFAHGYGTEAEAIAHPNDPAQPAQAGLLATFLFEKSIGQGGPDGILTIDTINAQGKSTGHVGPGHNPVVNPQNLSWSLAGSGFAGWFTRALKLLFGGVLMIIGISRLTGADNAVLQLARKAPGAAVLL